MHSSLLLFLIDDDQDDQEIFSFIVDELGIDIRLVCAASGVEAIEKLEHDTSFTPDFIFLDINMPLMNGFECLAALKSIHRIVDIPIYMYSTADAINVHHQYPVAPEGFIKKDADPDLIRKNLQEVLAGKLPSSIRPSNRNNTVR